MRSLLLAAALARNRGTPVMDTEEPPFTVELRQGEFEVRDDPPLIVAEVSVTGDRRDAAAIGAHAATDYYDATARVFSECLEGDHLEEIGRRGVTDAREMYKLVNGLKLERFETI